MRLINGEHGFTGAQCGGGGGGGAIGTPSFGGCLNCGLDGHVARKCNSTPCPYCGLRFCFGARKRGPLLGCLVKKIVGGGCIEPSDVGLNGKPIADSLATKIKEKAAELAAAKAKEANTASQTEANVIDDDLIAGGESD